MRNQQGIFQADIQVDRVGIVDQVAHLLEGLLVQRSRYKAKAVNFRVDPAQVELCLSGSKPGDGSIQPKRLQLPVKGPHLNHLLAKSTRKGLLKFKFISTQGHQFRHCIYCSNVCIQSQV